LNRGSVATSYKAYPSSTKAIATAAMRTPHILEALAHRDQEQHQRKQHGRADVLLGRLARMGAFFLGVRGFLVEVRGLLQLGIVVLGHVGGPRRRRRRGERCRLQPGIERRPVFRAEPAHEHRLKLGIVGALCHQPLVERGRVGRQPLLTGDGDGGGLDPIHTRFGVQDRLAAVPLGRLEATPGRGDRSHRQQEDPHNLKDLFPAPALPDGLLALGQLVGNLQVHVLGHIRTSSPSQGRSCATSWRCGLCSRPRTTIRWLVDRSLSPC
jgi:hypothetical protein